MRNRYRSRTRQNWISSLRSRHICTLSGQSLHASQVEMAAITSASSAVVARPTFAGKTEALRARAVAPVSAKRASVVTLASADETSRRAALSVFTVSVPPTRPSAMP